MVSPENLANIMGKKYFYSFVSKEPNYYICFALSSPHIAEHWETSAK